MSTRPNGGPPPSVARKRAAVTLPPSPYERLWKRHQVEALEQRASVLVGYRALGDGQLPRFPDWLLADIPAFAVAVMRLCRSHLALEEICDVIPDAEERNDVG